MEEEEEGVALRPPEPRVPQKPEEMQGVAVAAAADTTVMVEQRKKLAKLIRNPIQ